MKKSIVPVAAEHQARRDLAPRPGLSRAAPHGPAFDDSRATAIAQRSLAALAADSPHATALRAHAALIQGRAADETVVPGAADCVQLKRVSNLTRLTRANVREPWKSTSPGTRIDEAMSKTVMKPLKTARGLSEHVGGHLIQESMGGSGALADGTILPWSRNFEEHAWVENVDDKIQRDIHKARGGNEIYLKLDADYSLGGPALAGKYKTGHPAAPEQTLSAIECLPTSVWTSWGIGRVPDLETLTEDGDDYEKDKYAVQIAGAYATGDFRNMHGIGDDFGAADGAGRADEAEEKSAAGPAPAVVEASKA